MYDSTKTEDKCTPGYGSAPGYEQFGTPISPGFGYGPGIFSPGYQGYNPGYCPGYGTKKEAANPTIQDGYGLGFNSGFAIVFLVILILLLFPGFFGGSIF